MKLAIVFEVPDGQADEYADVAAKAIQGYTFATQQATVKHWSFDLEMRPVAAAAADTDAGLVDNIRQALETLT